MTDSDPCERSPDDSTLEKSSELDVRDIVHRLQTQVTNPVTRARLRVEQEVPEARRGPGWDRHWRELEAYVELPGEWPGNQGTA